MKDYRAALSLLILSLFLSSAGLAQGPDSQFRVVITDRPARAEIEMLKRAVPAADIVMATSKEELLSKISNAEVLIGSCDPDVIKAGNKLRWVQSFSAGVENCIHPPLVNSNITLTNCKIVQGPEIADHAFAMLLAHTRQVTRAFAYKERQQWGQDDYDPIELRGKTALIIGLGGIGTQVAQRAFAFGMTVLALDPKDIPFQREVSEVGKPDQLHDFLPRADVVFMCAPHTPETEKMMGAREFSLMKRGAYYINVSRGMTTDTHALIEALNSGHLAAAGVDVMDPEPLPEDHPLWNVKNLIITPHIATRSDHGWERRMDVVEDNLRRFSQGQPLRNVVDKQKGY